MTQLLDSTENTVKIGGKKLTGEEDWGLENGGLGEFTVEKGAIREGRLFLFPSL